MRGCLYHIIAWFVGIIGILYFANGEVGMVIPVLLIGLAVFIWFLGFFAI